MTGDRLGRGLASASEDWVDADLIREDQREAILDYEDAPSGSDGLASLLYAVAGLLLGAAAIALVATTGGVEAHRARLAALAWGLAAAGAGLHLAPVDRDRFTLLADALLVAGLVALAAAVVENRDAQLLAPAALAASLALGAWRRASFVAPLAVVAFAVLAAATADVHESALGLEDETLWALLQAGLLAALAAASLLDEVGPAPGALAVGGFAIATSLWLLEPVGWDSVAAELALAGCLAAILVPAAALDLQGLATGAAIALAADAVVFAFDAGGVLLGVGTLVGLAALAIWQAETLRGYLSPREWVTG